MLDRWSEIRRAKLMAGQALKWFYDALFDSTCVQLTGFATIISSDFTIYAIFPWHLARLPEDTGLITYCLIQLNAECSGYP